MRRRTVLRVAVAAAGSMAALRFLGRPPTDGPLFVRRTGDHGSAVLLLHGLFASGACWLPLAGQLASSCRMVMPDLAGFGSSPQPDADYTAAFHLRWLEPVIAEAPRWLVVGHSMGCAVAAELARRRPEAVAGLVLLNAPVYSSPDRMREIVGRHNLLTRLSLLSPLAARLVCEATVCTPRPLLTTIAPWLRPDVPPAAASDYFRHTFDSYHSSLMNLVASGDLMRTLAAIEPPALVVQGSDDDVVGGDGLRWPPHIRMATVEGANHTDLLLTMPERTASIVREFLATPPVRRRLVSPE